MLLVFRHGGDKAEQQGPGKMKTTMIQVEE